MKGQKERTVGQEGRRKDSGKDRGANRREKEKGKDRRKRSVGKEKGEETGEKEKGARGEPGQLL